MKKWHKRQGLIISTAVITLLLLLFTSCYFHDSLLERRFETVKEGMSEQDVLSVLGKPHSVASCSGVVGYPNDCSREYVYFAYLPTIMSWRVFLNEHGIVVGKYRFESP